MPELYTPEGLRLHYIERGAGSETVVFSHSYLVDHRHFEPQIAALEGQYRVVAFDHRDHGQSAHARTSYQLSDLVDDALAVLAQTCDGPVHWVGLSTGGFVGLRLALQHPQWLKSLTLLDTSAEAEPLWKRIKYQGMFAVLRALGVRPLLPQVMREMFGASTLRDSSKEPMLRRWREILAAIDPAAAVRFGDAIFTRDDVLDQLGGIRVPVLVIVGQQDRATPVQLARNIATNIPSAQLIIIPDAGHLSTLEQPALIDEALLSFIGKASPP